MELTREKLGRKRKIRLPSSLVIPAEGKARRGRTQTAPAPVFDEAPAFEEAPGQMSMEDLMETEKPEE